MAYKPSDFFVTVTDFFTVLLPGAVFTVLHREQLQKELAPVLPELSTPLEQRNASSSARTLWAPPLLVQVTLSPAWMVSCAGSKVRLGVTTTV